MKKINILKKIIPVAETCGDVTDMGVYEKWLYLVADAEDGTKIRFEVNIIKGEEKNGD